MNILIKIIVKGYNFIVLMKRIAWEVFMKFT